jgi:hypothetical protein
MNDVLEEETAELRRRNCRTADDEWVVMANKFKTWRRE